MGATMHIICPIGGERNIFHLFCVVASKIWDVLSDIERAGLCADVTFVMLYYEAACPGHRWLASFVEAMLRGTSCKLTLELPPEVEAAQSLTVLKTENTWMFNCWAYEERYGPCRSCCSLADRVRPAPSERLLSPSPTVAFVQRSGNRILYDTETRRPLEDVLQVLMPSIRVVRFEDLTAQEQAAQLRDVAVLVGCHGAGLTNMVFLPDHAHVVEVSLRGTRSFVGPDGSDTYMKADFHNMARVFGRGYTERPCDAAEVPMIDGDPAIYYRDVFVSAARVYLDIKAGVAQYQAGGTLGFSEPCCLAGWLDHPVH